MTFRNGGIHYTGWGGCKWRTRWNNTRFGRKLTLIVGPFVIYWYHRPLQFFDKYGFPVERIKGRPVTNLIRLLLHTRRAMRVSL